MLHNCAGWRHPAGSHRGATSAAFALRRKWNAAVCGALAKFFRRRPARLEGIQGLLKLSLCLWVQEHERAVCLDKSDEPIGFRQLKGREASLNSGPIVEPEGFLQEKAKRNPMSLEANVAIATFDGQVVVRPGPCGRDRFDKELLPCRKRHLLVGNDGLAVKMGESTEPSPIKSGR